MNNSKKILLDSISSWERSDKKIIVGIDGYSGAGKTTLIEGIENENKNILPINRDDFAIPHKEFWDKFEKAKDEQEKIDIIVDQTINIGELADFLRKFKKENGKISWNLRNNETGIKNDLRSFDFSKKILVIEGIFLFKHDKVSKLLDKKVFLNINQELADERRRKREKERWGDDYFPDTHPNSAYRLTRIGFNQYLEKFNPRKQADLVIDL